MSDYDFEKAIAFAINTAIGHLEQQVPLSTAGISYLRNRVLRGFDLFLEVQREVIRRGEGVAYREGPKD